MAECIPEIQKPVVWRCGTADDTTPVKPEVTDALGHPFVQAPIKYCGDSTPVCYDDSVSGCITDSDGASTSYGPAPTSPPPHVGGHSPIMSRVRVDRAGEPPLPYSGTHHPDQLIDVVTHAGHEIGYSGGTFKLPGPITPGGEFYPEDPDGNPIIGVKLPGGTVVFNTTTGEWELPPYPVVPPIPEVHPYINNRGVLYGFTAFQEAPATSVPSSFGNVVVAQKSIGSITNPDPIHKATLVVTGQSDASCKADLARVNAIETFSTELVVSFNGGGGWNKVHEVGYSLDTTAGRKVYGTTAKNVFVTHTLAPGETISVMVGVRLNNYLVPAAGKPADMGLTICDIKWFTVACDDSIAATTPST